jgi:hypothetical protein
LTGVVISSQKFLFHLIKTKHVFHLTATYNEAMNAGLQTSEDYLQLWHSYLDFLRRSLPQSSDTNREKREAQIEELRDAFQKGINQLFDCKLNVTHLEKLKQVDFLKRISKN